MKKKINIPKFQNEDQERNFWSKINLTDYFESDNFRPAAFPNLKPSSRSISLRVPEFMLIRIKEQANELNVPYQSLMKKYIAQGIIQKSPKMRQRN